MRAMCLSVADVDWSPGGGEGGTEEDDDGQNDEEEGSGDTAAATQGSTGDVVARQETQRGDAAAAAVETGRTGQGTGRRDRTYSVIHFDQTKLEGRSSYVFWLF